MTLLIPFLETADVRVSGQFTRSACGRDYAAGLPEMAAVTRQEDLPSQRVLENADMRWPGGVPNQGLESSDVFIDRPD